MPFLFLALFFTTSNAFGLSRVCFSPNYSCSCEANAVELLGMAKKKVDLAIYAINNKNITSAIIEAKKRGVDVRFVYDKSQSVGSEKSLNALAGEGIEGYHNYKHKIEHNKFIVVDDALVMNGSFNFTETAEHKNSENCTVHDNERVIKAFSDRFQYLFDFYKFRHQENLLKKQLKKQESTEKIEQDEE